MRWGDGVSNDDAFSLICWTVKSDDHSSLLKSILQSGQWLVAFRIWLQIIPHVGEGT